MSFQTLQKLFYCITHSQATQNYNLSLHRYYGVRWVYHYSSLEHYSSCIVQFLVESCMTNERPAANTVALHQISFNQSEYRASCATGYKLTGNENMISCHEQQWSPHEPRCEPAIAGNFPTSFPILNSSLSTTGKIIWIHVQEWWRVNDWGFGVYCEVLVWGVVSQKCK